MNNANENTYFKLDQRRGQGSSSRPNATNQSFSLERDRGTKVFDWTGFSGDERFINWIKACLSLRVCMTYLEPFVQETVERCYRKIRHADLCEGLTANEINTLKQQGVGFIEWRLRLDSLADQAKRYTRQPGAVKGDAVAKMLILDSAAPWQLARLYMGDTSRNNLAPTTGPLTFKSFDYIDLIHYMERCKIFDEFTKEFGRVRSVLRWRNNLMHAPGYLISEKHLRDCVEAMGNVLRDPALNAYLDATPFADQLAYIVRNPLSVVLGEMTRVPNPCTSAPRPVRSESPLPDRKLSTPPPHQPSTSSHQEKQEETRPQPPSGYVARFKSMFGRLRNLTGTRSEPSLLKTFSNYLIGGARSPKQPAEESQNDKHDQPKEGKHHPTPAAVVPGNSRKRPATATENHHLGCKLKKLRRV